MNPTVVDLTKDDRRAEGTAANEPTQPGESDDLAVMLLDQVDRKLESFRSGVAEDVCRIVLDRIDEAVARKLEEKGSAGDEAPVASETTRDLLLDVLKSALFDSGVLEKFVDRCVSRKLDSKPEAAADGVESAVVKALDTRAPEIAKRVQTECLNPLRSEIASIAQKEAAAALSGENLKILIDEKFRAISIYLKTDVIPKAVAQALRGGQR